MEQTKISCIIDPVHEGSLLAKPPLNVNGKKYPYEFGQRIDLPRNVVEVARGCDALLVTLLGTAAPIPEPVAAQAEPTTPQVDETGTESPAGNGGGDGAAEATGGATGGADTPPQGDEAQDASSALDHDGDGEPGGSLPHDPPALKGKTKDELIQIAADEGVDLGDASNNPARIAAIEAHRAAQTEA